MKLKFIILPVILVFSTTAFSQPRLKTPAEIVTKFFELVYHGRIQESVELADEKLLIVEGVMYGENYAENKYVPIIEIEKEKLQIVDVSKEEINGNFAKIYTFIKNKDGRIPLYEIFLVNADGWKISAWRKALSPINPVLPKHKGYPIKKDCPKCV